MRVVLVLILAIALMGGGCQPFIIGTAALQAVPALVAPVAGALGNNIALLLNNAFAPLLEVDMDTNGG